MRDAYCPHDDYTVHCNCWWDGHRCCYCDDGPPGSKRQKRICRCEHCQQFMRCKMEKTMLHLPEYTPWGEREDYYCACICDRCLGKETKASKTSERVIKETSDKRREAMTALADR